MSGDTVVEREAVAVSVEPTLIELRGVTRVFRNGEIEVPVLHGIDLEVRRGEFVAIVGASGSGKSTLMNILGCLDRPTGGSYRFMGRDVSRLDRDELAQLRREAFGFVFQSYNLIPGSSALENVEMPAVYLGMPPALRRERARELLTGLGLGERLDHRPSQLSGGQQQRVSIARALMNGGGIILADEPTGALDSHSGTEVMKLLTRLASEGHTVILITHAAEVAAHADRVIEISDGRIVADSGTRTRRGGTEPALAPAPASAPESAAAAKAARELPLPRTRSAPLTELLEAVRTALRALRADLFRAVLTLLGIVIGVGSVIAMLAIGDGARQQVVDRISAMGSNLLLVRPGMPNQRGRGVTATLVADDAVAIGELPNVLAAVPELTGSATLRVDGNDHATEVNATSAGFPLARNWPVARGSFFDADDQRSYATVAVIGRSVADALFPGTEPLGRHLVVNNVMFQVIGVMSERGASPMGSDQDDVVFVPFETGSLRLFGQRYLRNLTVAVADESRIADTQQAVHSLLLQRHGVEDFQIRNMASLIDDVSATQDTLTVLLGSIAAISLLVGGIGVMNIMLVNVTERTREIGIRMAAGARTRNILQQFLTEALVVSAIGGAIGVAGGLGTAALLQALGTPVQFSGAPVALAFGCAFLTGLVFGWLPANKAARLDPVVALSKN